MDLIDKKGETVFFMYTILCSEYARMQDFASNFQKLGDGSWIYNYLCNQCISPLKLCVRIPLMVRCRVFTSFLLNRSDLNLNRPPIFEN
jgi:hypothetical protein